MDASHGPYEGPLPATPLGTPLGRPRPTARHASDTGDTRTPATDPGTDPGTPARDIREDGPPDRSSNGSFGRTTGGDADPLVDVGLPDAGLPDTDFETGIRATPAHRSVRRATASAEADPEPEGFSFVTLLRRATDALSPQATAEAAAEDELGPAFAESSDAERAMVRNILRLHDLRVEDVMTPRADIVAVSEDASLDDVTAALQRGSLSRLPVYRETLDDPLGFVHLKDLALCYGVGCSERAALPFSLTDHLRTALYVPPSMRIAALLQKMQGARVHMALVIDEFGGVDGLVTIEDLVEQIVGDIEDEHDGEDGSQWRGESPGVYLVDARTDIREFEKAEGVKLLPEDWEEEVDTLGGLVFMLTGRVPVRGEVVSHPMGHEFEVTDADPRKIRRLRLTLQGLATGGGVGDKSGDAAPATVRKGARPADGADGEDREAGGAERAGIAEGTAGGTAEGTAPAESDGPGSDGASDRVSDGVSAPANSTATSAGNPPEDPAKPPTGRDAGQGPDRSATG